MCQLSERPTPAPAATHLPAHLSTLSPHPASGQVHHRIPPLLPHPQPSPTGPNTGRAKRAERPLHTAQGSCAAWRTHLIDPEGSRWSSRWVPSTPEHTPFVTAHPSTRLGAALPPRLRPLPAVLPRCAPQLCGTGGPGQPPDRHSCPPPGSLPEAPASLCSETSSKVVFRTNSNAPRMAPQH